MKEKTSIALIIVLTFAFAGFGIYYSIAWHPTVKGEPIPSNVQCQNYSDNFTIIANQDGFNGSVLKGVPKNYWPVLCVKEGTYVTIVVINNDPVQPHGFSITHYFDQSIALMPGQKFVFRFYADETGAFYIRCTVLCTVHWAMLSGIIIVK